MAAKRTASHGYAAPAARRLWDVTVAHYELNQHEQVLLREICRTMDVIEDLQKILEAEGVMQQRTFREVGVHPVLTALRSQRLTLSKLMRDLQLPMGLEPTRAVLPALRTRFETQLKAVSNA